MTGQDTPLDTNSTHTVPDPDQPGQLIQVECIQKDTINRIFRLWQELDKRQENFQRHQVTRDQKLKDAFDQTTTTVKDLITELDKRKLINNYNEKEKAQLKELIQEDKDDGHNLSMKVGEMDNRLTTVETNLTNVIEMAGDTARKYDRMFWLLVAFFILFIVKTFIWGY
jgi:predicted transcriptional regulator